jgi:FixJ family two-component response regulator
MSKTATEQRSPVVYLVDDDPSLLKVLSHALEAEGLETRAFISPRLFLTEHDSNVPGCVILDLAMPHISGLDVQRSITNAEPNRPIIFMSGKADIAASVTAMKNGAVDFLVKPFTNEVLLQAVKKAIEKDRATRTKRDLALELKERYLRLTVREREVFSQLLLGKLNKQAAGDLGITEKTVKTHRSRIHRKMGAASFAELAHLAEILRSSQVALDEWRDDQAE